MNMPDAFNMIYLVDLENIGAKQLYQHTENHKNAEYIIFYSDNTITPSTILEHIPAVLQVKFINCRTSSNNAMDFCISATAGRLSMNPKNIVRILSDDKGYDPMLYMLQEQGMRIVREKSTYRPEQKLNDIPEVYDENLSIVKAIRSNVSKDYQDKLVAVLPKASNREEAHNMIQTIMPRKMVAETYRKLKKHIPKEVI